jgi:two-component system, NarL family, nitrate/nitrite response regulator NarL
LKALNKIKVLVVDDHPMVLEGMKSMLIQIAFVDLLGTVSNAFEVVELFKKTIPDILITDINMPEISGIELTTKIRTEFPQVKVIAMSTFKERSYISQMIQIGASGYLVKTASKEEIEEAILSVYEGKLYMSLDINLSDEDKKTIGKIPVISSREKEVLELIADGLTNPQIAERLFLSLHTVDSHRKNLLTKFGTNNAASLIKLAAKYNMI